MGEMPCIGPSDPRLVLAPARNLPLTTIEVVNSIRVLIDDTIATAILTDPQFSGIFDEARRQFPPLVAEGPSIDVAKRSVLNAIASEVAQYVFDNHEAVTGCPAPATDACAKAYILSFAERAYRRPLTTSETSNLVAMIDGATPSAATSAAVTQQLVRAILTAPRFVYRSELGRADTLPSPPPTVPLTEYELATELGFFLTDMPPDQPLLDAAAAGTLSANVSSEVDRLLATPAARSWLTTMMFTWFRLNTMAGTTYAVDATKFPEFDAQLVADLHTEALLFLDGALWSGDLTGLLLSRTAFLNSSLATTIYGVPVPSGASATSFVQTTLPVGERAGLLTNAGFLLNTGVRPEFPSLVVRGESTLRWMLCKAPMSLTDTSVFNGENGQGTLLATETAQEQVAYRASMPACGGCHSAFDPYGLVVANFDVIGRYRAVDDTGRPIDAHATLPPALGAATVMDATAFAQVLAASPAFLNCMADAVLVYAMADADAVVELPSLPGESPSVAGCAVRDVAQRSTGSATRTFSDLVRAVTTSPAFLLRTTPPLRQ